MATRQEIIYSLPTPFYMNETGARQEIVLTTYVNETVAAASGSAWVVNPLPDGSGIVGSGIVG